MEILDTLRLPFTEVGERHEAGVGGLDAGELGAAVGEGGNEPVGGDLARLVAAAVEILGVEAAFGHVGITIVHILRQRAEVAGGTAEGAEAAAAEELADALAVLPFDAAGGADQAVDAREGPAVAGGGALAGAAGVDIGGARIVGRQAATAVREGQGPGIGARGGDAGRRLQIHHQQIAGRISGCVPGHRRLGRAVPRQPATDPGRQTAAVVVGELEHRVDGNRGAVVVEGHTWIAATAGRLRVAVGRDAGGGDTGREGVADGTAGKRPRVTEIERAVRRDHEGARDHGAGVAAGLAVADDGDGVGKGACLQEGVIAADVEGPAGGINVAKGRGIAGAVGPVDGGRVGRRRQVAAGVGDGGDGGRRGEGHAGVGRDVQKGRGDGQGGHGAFFENQHFRQVSAFAPRGAGRRSSRSMKRSSNRRRPFSPRSANAQRASQKRGAVK